MQEYKENGPVGMKDRVEPVIPDVDKLDYSYFIVLSRF